MTAVIVVTQVFTRDLPVSNITVTTVVAHIPIVDHHVGNIKPIEMIASAMDTGKTEAGAMDPETHNLMQIICYKWFARS